MATHTSALAQTYARSLYELAERAGGREKIFEAGEELEQICELARGDRTFAEFLASPIVDRSRRGEALKQIFSDRVTDLTLRFLLVINDKDRLQVLESINTAYDQIVQEAHGRIEVDVFTATTLDDGQLRAIADRIGAALGKEAVLHPYTDPSLLGGIRLRIGDQLIDGSVATRVRRLKQSLLNSGASAMRGRFDRVVEEDA